MTNLSFIASACMATAACGLGVTALAGGFNISSTPSFPFQNLLNAEDIKNKYLNLKCTKDLFGEITWTDIEEEADDDEDEDEYAFAQSHEIKSCLMVWWTQKTYDNNKRMGYWNLLWTVKDDSDGIILTSTIKTKNNGKLSVDAVAYSLNNEENDKWETLAKEAKQETEIESSKEMNLIIKPGNDLDRKLDNWGFDFTTTNNICLQADNCIKETKLDFKGFVWEWTANGADKQQIKNWSSNFEEWNKAGGLFEKHSEEDYQSVEGKFKLTYKYES